LKISAGFVLCWPWNTDLSCPSQTKTFFATKFFLNETGYRSQTYCYNQTNVSVTASCCMVSKGGEGATFITAKRGKMA